MNFRIEKIKIWVGGNFWCYLITSARVATAPVAPAQSHNIMAACEGPARALRVVLVPQFDLRAKATPQGFFFLHLSSPAQHVGHLGHRERKSRGLMGIEIKLSL